ncbi:HNH endonuclease [Clostridium cochlearium]|uniref:HNH endonuclease n=1 Tax=Clostridium cochlearium TaxID=1494 RepID=A0A7Y3V7J9_CLOCO|nr:HNH endonuclease [Clostridium cochlearium]
MKKGTTRSNACERRVTKLCGKYRICGINDERFLIASYIKPWSISNDNEKLNDNNGILLCSNNDILFDKGYIF